MILFVVKGEVDSDKFIRFGYSNYRDLCGHLHDNLPEKADVIREGKSKPRLDVEGVHFNLSHSHGVVVLGFSHTEIGVDVEKSVPLTEQSLRLLMQRTMMSFLKSGQSEKAMAN